MAQRTRRRRTTPRIESCEDRTMLSGFGVNVDFNYQYSAEAVWTDVSRLLAKWNYVGANWGTPNPSVVVNALDSPLTDASGFMPLVNYPDGVYQVSFKGNVNLGFKGVGSLVAPLVKGADGVTRGRILVDGANDISGGLRGLIMDVTSIDPSDPLSDLDIIAPGYPADGSQQYTTQFLQQLQPFDDVRFLNWGLANGSSEVHWSDRADPSQIVSSFVVRRPIEYEAMIELGNEAHKNIWLNVPALADDAYIKNLADLVRDNLDPGLKVYVEYSNETWNAAFPQRAQVLAAAAANPLVTATNDVARAAQQTAFRLKQISDIFRQEFGANFNRVIPVLGGWTVMPSVIQTELQFIQQNYGNPSQFVGSTAIAPYFGLVSGTDTVNQTPAGMFASMNQAIDQRAVYIQQNAQIAASYGLPLDAYEAGQALYGNTNKAMKWAVQDDYRMYSTYKHYFDVWKNAGGGEMNLFTLYGDFWGLKNRVTDPGNQKFDAVVSSIVPAGDADLNGKVDFADFQVLAANYDQTGKWWTQGDFDHDGRVDSADLDALLSHIDAGVLTADQAAQIALFSATANTTDDQAIEFELYGRKYAGDLGFTTLLGGPVAVDGVYNGTSTGAGAATLGGTVYNKGLGVSSNSRVNLSLNGAYTSFDATIGVDDRAGAGNGRSVFQVFGDGQLLYTSPVMAAGAASIPIEVSVKGVATLSLVVSTTGNASPSTPADWSLARLIRSPSTPAAPPTTLSWSVTKNGVPFATSTADSFVFTPSEPGNYVVKVQATDSNGATAARSEPIVVGAASNTTSAAYVTTDVTSKGVWKGVYGSAGYSMANYGRSLPAYALASVSGGMAKTWNANAADVRGLQKPDVGALDRVASTWYGNQFTINLELTDDKIHEVSLYAVDWYGNTTSQRIDVINADTGQVLDSRTISAFQTGKYVTWKVSGRVQFRVTRLAGTEALVSGLFVETGQPAPTPPPPPPPPGAGAYLGRDDLVQGSWKGSFGADGYGLPVGGAGFPSYAVVGVAGGNKYTWSASTNDVRALQKPAASATDRIASTWYGSQFTIDVNMTDGQAHKVSLYALDWDRNGRSERIDVIDAATGQVLDTRTVSSFQNGSYLTWSVSGHVQFRVTKLSGVNAVVSGLFFDGGQPPPPPGAGAYLGRDDLVQGSWKGSFGVDGYGLPVGGAGFPSYAAVGVAGGNKYTWSASTNDVRALQKPAASATDRIASTWYGSQFTIDVNMTDGQAHKVSLYALDWDRNGRSERIDVIDAATGQVLDTRTVSSFQNGSYLTWSVSGHVQFRVTKLSGVNAVVSGLFFD